MSINITDGFNINFAAPVDYRMVTANSTTRLAIAYKYDGLKVFQLDNRVSYIWNSGGSGNWDIENSDKISGSGFTNYIPKFTSTSQIGASSIYVNGDKVGIATNDPKEYMQIGSFPVAYPGQSLPLTIHKGGSAIIGYNWYYDGGDQSFNSSVGSSTIGFGSGEIQFQHKEVSSSFKTSLYLKSNGNVLIGTNTPTQISGSSSMFTNAFPKLDIITGESSGSYQELMTLRHNMDSSVALRRLGYIMKMSNESTLVESNKMGGMILESSSGYADYPSLHLTTGDQKRLGISWDGNVGIGVSSNTSIHSGSSLFNSITPKLEVLVGTSSANYQDLMVLRGLKGSESNTLTRLGIIMKLSDENDTNESNKMGGMILESTTQYSNFPSLHLITSNQKRLTVSSDGDVSIPGGTLPGTAGSKINFLNLSSVANLNNNNLEFNTVRSQTGGNTTWETSGYRIQAKVDGIYMGYMQFNGSNNPTGVSIGTGYMFNDSTGGTSSNAFDRLVIDGSGRVMIGATSSLFAPCMLQLKSNATLYDGMLFRAYDDTTFIVEFQNSSGVTRGNIDGIDSSSINYNSSSDRRLKNNIQEMPSMYNIVKSLKPSKFDWKCDNQEGFGFIAQEVFDILPNLRGGLSELYFNLNDPEFDIENPKRKDGTDYYYGLDYGKLTPYLTKALQETMEKLEDLTNKIKSANTLEELKSSL